MKVGTYPLGEEIRCTSQLSEEVAGLPFYSMVPKDLEDNLKFRLILRERARCDSKVQRDLMAICRADPLYWINTFCWLHEPRATVKHIPFISWPHQDTFFMHMHKYLGRRDIGVEKSRGEGVSWLVLMLFLHWWIFDPTGPIFALVSKNEDGVDKRNDPNCLMYKLDYQIERLPFWMLPVGFSPHTDRLLQSHSMFNRVTGAAIIGYPATGDVTRGGRPTAIAMDEMAAFPVGNDYNAFDATQHATECRIVISTPQGDIGAFADIMHRRSSMLKLIVHWTENKWRKQGLYTVADNGRIRMIDRNYKLPPDYEHPKEYGFVVRDGGYWFDENIFIPAGTKVWSPWYDSQCHRPGATPQSIAQELDLDYGGSAFKFFGHCLEVARRGCRTPLHRGVMSWNDMDEPAIWTEVENGPFLLWRELNEKNHIEDGWFAVGVDIGAGTGGDYTSNSVVEVIDRESGDQVLEYATMTVSPEDLARLVSAICQWLKQTPGSHVMLNWDALGPTGSQFTRSLIANTKWRSVYQQVRDVTRRGKKTKETRLGNVRRDRMEVLGPFRDAIGHGQVHVYSIDLVRECSEWEIVTGRLEHVPSARTKIESGATHGDRAIAMAQAWILCKERAVPPKAEEPEEIPWNCMQWRMENAKAGVDSSDLLEAVW